MSWAAHEQAEIVEHVRMALAEVAPASIVRIQPRRDDPTLLTIAIGPPVPRTPEHEQLGRYRWRAAFIARQKFGGPGRCWECWWADRSIHECDHESVWA